MVHRGLLSDTERKIIERRLRRETLSLREQGSLKQAKYKLNKFWPIIVSDYQLIMRFRRRDPNVLEALRKARREGSTSHLYVPLKKKVS